MNNAIITELGAALDLSEPEVQLLAEAFRNARAHARAEGEQNILRTLKAISTLNGSTQAVMKTLNEAFNTPTHTKSHKSGYDPNEPRNSIGQWCEPGHDTDCHTLENTASTALPHLPEFTLIMGMRDATHCPEARKYLTAALDKATANGEDLDALQIELSRAYQRAKKANEIEAANLLAHAVNSVIKPLTKAMPNEQAKQEGVPFQGESGRWFVMKQGRPVPYTHNKEQPGSEQTAASPESAANGLTVEGSAAGQRLAARMAVADIGAKLRDGKELSQHEQEQLADSMKYLTASERKQFARITGYEHQEERELLPHQHINPQTGLPDRARVGVPAMETPPPPSRIPRLPNLSEKERAVETQFAEAFLDDPDAFVDKYLKALAKGKVGVERNVFATDDVKMLNRDWNPGKVKVGEALDDETQKAMAKYNTAIHATANAIAKRAFLKYLDDVVKKLPEGKRSVLVTCGGCASGKGSSTARAADPNSPYAKMLPAAHHVGAVWDAAGEQNATENEWVLQECKRRGIKPIFAYIHADPKETWEAEDRGVIRRAIRKGRMVDARLFADSYAEGAKNMHAFHQRHKDDGTQFIFLDNRTKGEPKPLVGVPSEALEWDADDIYSDAVNTLQRRAADLPKALVKGGLNGMKIWGAPKPKKMLKAVMKAVRHAPAGGITIAGEFFRGGQFIPDDVYDKASEEEKAQLAEGKSDDDTPTAEAKPEPEPEEEPADEWDGTIEDSEVEVFDPEHDEEVTTYAQYDEDEGTKKEISVYVQKGLYTTPQGDEIEVYRWVEADESNPDEILNTGEWTEDLDEAKQEANEHADAEDQPMPELTDDMIKSDMIDNENYGHAIASYYHTPHGNEANVLLYTGTVELYGEEHDVYKWVAQDEEDDIIAEGEWTFNKDKAKADGKDHAYVEDVEQENDEEDYPSEFTPASDNKPNEDLPDETRPDIDDETAQYLNNYSWGYDGPMNAALRNTWEPPPGMFGGNREGKPDKDGPEMFAKMREAFADAPTFGPPPITVHRGIRELPNEIRDRLMAAAEHAMENGLTIAMGGFVSTATRSSASFDGPLKFQIDAIHGLDLKPYSHFPGERELLLNHGCQYRVKNVIRGREYHTIHLEQVTNGTEPPPPEMIALDGKERVLKAMKDNSNNNEDRRSQLDKRQDRFNADYDEARSWLKAFENGVKVEDTKEGTDNEKR